MEMVLNIVGMAFPYAPVSEFSQEKSALLGRGQHVDDNNGANGKIL